MPRRGSPHRAPFFVKEALFELRTLLGEERLARASGLRVRTTVHLDLQVRPGPLPSAASVCQSCACNGTVVPGRRRPWRRW